MKYLAGWMIPVAGLLVPRSLRDEWRCEWQAEFAHASETLPSHWKRIRFASGAFSDAWWHHRNRLELDHASRHTGKSPLFCLGVLLAILGAIVLSSQGLPLTRAVVFPLAYSHPEHVATVAEGGMPSSIRSTVRREWAELWRSKSLGVKELATYWWTKLPQGGKHARVSENFFDLLGARTDHGTLLNSDCAKCAVLSYRAFDGQESIQIRGERYRVVGVLERGFWFLAQDIDVWTLDPGTSRQTGVVVRLRQDTSADLAKAELADLARKTLATPWDVLIDVSPVQDRVREVFIFFAAALGMAAIITGVALRVRWPRLSVQGLWRGVFFVGKTAMALLAVLLAGIEYTHATSLTMTGGTDLSAEPLATWLYLMGSMCVLAWSILDQRRRCRVCYRRLGLPAHVGCPGCLLLNWAGTEMVCLEGHGMLHVPEMASSWNDPERWMALDESWGALFARRQ